MGNNDKLRVGRERELTVGHKSNKSKVRKLPNRHYRR